MPFGSIKKKFKMHWYLMWIFSKPTTLFSKPITEHVDCYISQASLDGWKISCKIITAKIYKLDYSIILSSFEFKMSCKNTNGGLLALLKEVTVTSIAFSSKHTNWKFQSSRNYWVFHSYVTLRSTEEPRTCKWNNSLCSFNILNVLLIYVILNVDKAVDT